MRYPELTAPAQEQLVTDTFAGYNHNLRIGDGEFYEMENLTSSYYPLLSQRERRATVMSLAGVQGRHPVLQRPFDGASHVRCEADAGRKDNGFDGRVYLRVPGRVVFQHRG